MNQLINSLKTKMPAKTLTENGATLYSTTYNANLDFFGVGSSLHFNQMNK